MEMQNKHDDNCDLLTVRAHSGAARPHWETRFGMTDAHTTSTLRREVQAGSPCSAEEIEMTKPVRAAATASLIAKV